MFTYVRLYCGHRFYVKDVARPTFCRYCYMQQNTEKVLPHNHIWRDPGGLSVSVGDSNLICRCGKKGK